MVSIEQLLALLESGPTPSREIQRRLGMSQAAVSRLLGRAGDRVARIGRGRATRYAGARDLFGAGFVLPLFLVDEVGAIGQVGTLRSLSNGQYLVDSHGLFWLMGDAGSGLFDSLPYFLYDLRPSGFLGRHIARQLAAEWGVPSDPRSWQDDHIGQFLVRRGDDLPGNLLVGEAAANRANRRVETVVEDRAAEYPRLARRALGDEPVGSSAAGEQPKFAVYQREAGHVIVKFSPAAETADARRWRDLLRAEHHALALLRENDIPAAETELHLRGGRLFLESRRFDRCGTRGRRPALSLDAVDLEFAGEGQGWIRVGNKLRQRGLLDTSSFEQIAWSQLFGAWIGNTDMHLGNISLSPTRDGFRLLPLYDMVPMALASVRGELLEVELEPPIRTALNEAFWAPAGGAATVYWRRLAEDAQLSDELRATAQSHARRWQAILQR